MKPIYVPKGKAREYGDYAINIYTGCPHKCYYCFAPQVLHREREAFHNCVEPRKEIVQEVRRQLERENITGKLVHLCFTCDPYPVGADTTPTREIIAALKEHGNNVQILTKGDGRRDFDLLGAGDWFGVTISCFDRLAEITEPGAISVANRLAEIVLAREAGIKTWVSFEPVLDDSGVLNMLSSLPDKFDRVKIGKLNYHPSDIDWAAFGKQAERICKATGVDYYIKEGLREEMERTE